MSIIEQPDDINVPRPAKSRVLEPFRYLTGDKNPRLCLLVLNGSLQGVNVEHLWHHTALRVCADGGANRLYDHFNGKNFIPDFVAGDCDSIREDVKEYYGSHGTTTIKQATQYSTDFMKCIQLIVLYFEGEQDKLRGQLDPHDGLHQLAATVTPTDPVDIYVVGGVGGRFDQTMHLIHQLYKLKSNYPHLNVTLITADDVIFLVPKGITYVHYPSKSTFSTHKVPTCGLLPFEHTVTITSLGLKWDVTNWDSSISTLVSSSNGITGTTGFSLELSHDIVMNIETG